MSVNFYNPSCQETLNDYLFGLCDDQDGRKAYTNTDNPVRWTATVRNIEGRSCVFTAIDHCVIRENELMGRRRCDGMLTTEDHHYFVELKDVMKGWIEEAIEQLESTIQIFIDSHGMPSQRHRKAFACNRAHPYFHEFDNERNKRFFQTYGFRIDIQADIIMV